MVFTIALLVGACAQKVGWVVERVKRVEMGVSDRILWPSREGGKRARRKACYSREELKG